ncbi:UNVERIFIED_CONTAM: hypothetical protein K2H54_027090 [Gekko kuhli]
MLEEETNIERVWQEFRSEMDELQQDTRVVLADLPATIREALQQELQALYPLCFIWHRMNPGASGPVVLLASLDIVESEKRSTAFLELCGTN